MSINYFTRRDAAALAAMTALVIGGVAGCYSDHSTASTDVSVGNCTVPPVPAGATLVYIANFAFSPATVHVKSGNSVAFVNCEPTAIQHTATADAGGRFDTGTLNQGKASVQPLTGAGTIPYHCAIHPSMKATVIVDP